jgi:hypothetical protein
LSNPPGSLPSVKKQGGAGRKRVEISRNCCAHTMDNVKIKLNTTKCKSKKDNEKCKRTYLSYSYVEV